MPRGGGDLLWGNGAPLNTLEWAAHVLFSIPHHRAIYGVSAYYQALRPLCFSSLLVCASVSAGWPLGPAVYLAFIWRLIMLSTVILQQIMLAHADLDAGYVLPQVLPLCVGM